MPRRIPVLSIREASLRDAEAVKACLADAFEVYRDTYTPRGFKDTVLTSENAERRFRDMTVLVAKDAAGEVIGTVSYLALGSGEGHLRGMAVDPQFQGKGVGAQLLSAAERGLRERGCSRVTLDTTRPLKRASEFYRRHGYELTGVVSDFFGMELFEWVKRLE